jgi:acetyl esterase/lipase
MAAMTPPEREGHRNGERGEDGPLRPIAVALWYPVVDLEAAVALRPEVDSLLGKADSGLLAAASPLHQVTPLGPPVITFTGADDELVPVTSVQAFHDALTASGVRNELHVYRGAGHAFDFVPDLWNDTFAKCRTFLSEVVATA